MPSSALSSPFYYFFLIFDILYFISVLLVFGFLINVFICQEARIQVVRGLCVELTNEKYHDAPALQSRYSIYCACNVFALLGTLRTMSSYYSRQKVIEDKWSDLLASLEACKSSLSRYHDLMSVFAEMNDCLTTMGQIEVCSTVIDGLIHV